MTMTRPMNMAGSFNGPGLAAHRRRMLPVLVSSYIGNLKLAISFQRLRSSKPAPAVAGGSHGASSRVKRLRACPPCAYSPALRVTATLRRLSRPVAFCLIG
jgi:hypothetical protein